LAQSAYKSNASLRHPAKSKESFMFFFLGIFPPDLSSVILPIAIAGAIGFLLCRWRRFLVFLLLPAFIWLCLTEIKGLEFFVSLNSPYMMSVYATMIVSALAMIAGSILAWKKVQRDTITVPQN
jgi:hypothetical protein